MRTPTACPTAPPRCARSLRTQSARCPRRRWRVATVPSRFVVAYSIPSTATAANFTPPRPATINAVPATLDLYEVPNQTVADLDHVVLTVDAAFNASKSLRVPVGQLGRPTAVLARSEGPWSALGGLLPATIAGATSNDPNCSVHHLHAAVQQHGWRGRQVLHDGHAAERLHLRAGFRGLEQRTGPSPG